MCARTIFKHHFHLGCRLQMFSVHVIPTFGFMTMVVMRKKDRTTSKEKYGSQYVTIFFFLSL
jgi:hypothetical protein